MDLAPIGRQAGNDASAADKTIGRNEKRMIQTQLLHRLTSCLAALITATVLVSSPSVPAFAQNMFAPVITINGRAITRYEVDQRALFLQVLRTPGDLEKQAEEALVDERLQSMAAQAAGVVVSEEALRAGMSEFAARANLETEAFVAAIGEAGVSPETFRDFVLAGIEWRTYVQSRFAADARVTEAETDRALTQASFETGARVRLAEIVLGTDPQRVDRSLALIDDLQSSRSEEDFSAAARRFSLGPTRLQGGLRDWLNLSDLPPALAEAILILGPGEVSDPIPVGENVVAVFQVRALSQIGPRPAANVEVDYISVSIPGGRSDKALAEAERIREYSVNDCNRLYYVMRGQSPDRITRQQVSPRSLPTDIGLALADLDPGESNATVTRNNEQTLLFLMLCNRTPVLEGTDAREQAQLQLFNQRMTSLANGHLEELKAKAFINRP